MEEGYRESAMKKGPRAAQSHDLSAAHRGLGNTWKSYSNPERLNEMLEKIDAKFTRGDDIASDLAAYHAAKEEERGAGKEKKTAGRRKAKKTAGRRKPSKKGGRRTRKR